MEKLNFRRITLLEITEKSARIYEKPVLRLYQQNFIALPNSRIDFKSVNKPDRGGSSTSYFVRDRAGKKYFVKSNKYNEKYIPTTMAENERLQKLKHPNIATPDEIVVSGEIIFMLFQMEGDSLEKISNKVSSVHNVADIFNQISLGLKHIHDNDLVHGDINPSNILISRSGKVKICDLGNSRNLWGLRSIKGSTSGTEAYAPREQYRGIYTKKNDIFSLAITLIQILNKQDQFGIEAEYSNLRRGFFNIHTDYLRQLSLDQAKMLRNILLDALDDTPEYRPTVEEFNNKIQMSLISKCITRQIETSNKYGFVR